MSPSDSDTAGQRPINNTDAQNIVTINNQCSKDTQTQEPQTCFSFKKQPIPSRTSCHSAISSFIDPDRIANHNSTNSSNNSPEKITDQDAQLDYDEQIRAPRMSTLSKTNLIAKILEHEPLGDCDYIKRGSNVSSASTNNNDEFSDASRNTSTTSNASLDFTSLISNTTEQTKHYSPAVYDLSQPFRRYSSPSVSRSAAKDQLTYSEVARKALHNLQTNTTTSESNSGKPRDPRERICTDGPIRQIDEPKTPNYIPAVLRPPNFQSSNLTARKASFSSLGDPIEEYNSDSSSPNKMVPSLSNSSASTLKFMELPKSHWVPNNERPCCRMCDSRFSIINRKHHCRKCGEIFCINCCYMQASLNFKLNFDLINGVVSRVCNNCAIDYNQYVRKNFVNEGSSLRNDGLTLDKLQGADLLEREKNSSNLVPVDWNWSSF